ncbi:MAG TPA: hypothetical protein VLG49_01170 [Rhabdochlamydiaceae bacterium]|nr:hypothetical protein [Rhabdochlamydiaceae bacterium]
MDGNKSRENKVKEGVSVKEIEGFAKKHRFEVFFCFKFVLACFFSFVFFGPGWAVVFAVLGGLIGVIIPGRVDRFAKMMFDFVAKQEKVTQMVIAGVSLVLAIFLPFVTFFLIGLHGGTSMQEHARSSFSSK